LKEKEAKADQIRNIMMIMMTMRW